jgi:STE24 endopeptidase
MERQGIRVLGVYEWNDPDEALTANAVLAGLGRTRRVLLTSTLLRNYCEEEIQAVLAHEIAHYRRHDLWRHIVMGVLFSLICFLAVHHTLHNLLPFTGIRGIADIRSLPLLLMCVFIFSLLLMPLANTYARRLELAADHQAIHIMGSADPVISAMKHMAEDNMLEKQPSAWAEWLLHSHPSVTRRIARARQAEQQMKQ